MSDDSEVILSNVALRDKPQHLIKFDNWQFICFVNASMMTEFDEIDKMDSHILFLAKHKELQEARLFIIKVNPWQSSDPQNRFGKVLCLQTSHFELPNVSIS